MAYAEGIVYGTWNEEGEYQDDHARRAQDVKTAHFELDIGKWTDPFTAPRTKGPECVKVCDGPFGTKYCCEYSMKCKTMKVRAILIVDIGEPGDIRKHIRECHDNAAVAGLVGGIITAYLSGGAAAAEAAVSSYITFFTTCLEGKIAEDLLSVRINFRSEWTSWRNCT